MQRFIKIAITGLFSSGLLSCAVSPDNPATLEDKLLANQYMIGTEVNSVRNYSINGWNYVDDKFITVNTGVSNHYLIGFRNNCNEARYASSIAFTNTAGRLTSSDKVIIKGPSSYEVQCFIRTIYKLEKMKSE